MTRKLSPKDEITEFVIYKAPDEEIKVEVILHDENVWLTQIRM